MATKVTENSTGVRRNRDGIVMDVAIQVMSERGYAATSIQEVADRVGVLKGSLYHYFRSKEELLARILEEGYEQNDEIVEDVTKLGLDPFDELIEYLRRSCQWYLANVERANIFFTDGRHLTGEHLEKIRERGRQFEKFVSNHVRSAQSSGEIRQDLDARLVTRFILGSINNIRQWPSRSGADFTNQELSDAFITLVRSAIEAPQRS